MAIHSGLAASRDEIAQDLRRALFPKVIQDSDTLLAQTPSAPVHGLRASAYAGLQLLDQATNSLGRATAAREPDVALHTAVVRAQLARSAGLLDEAARTCQEATRLRPPHPLPWVLLALIRYDQGQFAAAQSNAVEAVKLESSSSLAHTALGMALQAQGRPAEAFPAYARARALDPADLRPRLGAGEVLATLGNHAEAIKAYREVLELRSDLTSARALLADSLLAGGQSAEAMSEARSVLAVEPGHTRAALVMARAHAARNDFRAAATQLDAYLERRPEDSQAAYLTGLYLLADGDDPRALKPFTYALSGRNKALAAAIGSAVVHQKNDDRVRVREFLEQAVAANDPSIREHAEFHRALLHLAGKEWDAARATFGRAAGFFPNARMETLDLSQFFSGTPAESLALTGRGALLLREGLLEPSVKALRTAVEKGRSNVIALLLLSNALARKADFDEALRVLADLRRLAPGYAPAAFAEGEVHTSRKAEAEARAAYAKAAELDSQFAPAFIRLATLHMTSGDLAAAEGVYRHLMNIAPNSPLAFNELAVLLADQGRDLNAALGFARKAVELGGRNGAFQDTLGWVQYKRGEFAEALRSFQTALALPLDPRFVPAVRYHLAFAKHKTGSQAEARQELEALLKLAPNAAEAAEAQAILQTLQARP